VSSSLIAKSDRCRALISWSNSNTPTNRDFYALCEMMPCHVWTGADKNCVYRGVIRHTSSERNTGDHSCALGSYKGQPFTQSLHVGVNSYMHEANNSTRAIA